MIPITIIVAASQNDVIGKDNQLPWHLPGDLAYFKKVTMGCPIIMGRKTYESIGKALPGRLNVVVTRNKEYQLDDAIVVSSLEEALEVARQQINAKEIHIIGGATIFEQALELIDKIYLNRVRANFDGDVYLPNIDWKQWSLMKSTYNQADEDNKYEVDFEVYEKNERL